MKNLILVLSAFLSVSALAKGKAHHHREHGAHHHGAGTLGIVLEENKGRIELKIPSESIIGFEYTPKTEKDKKTKDTQLVLLENKMGEMISFDASLKCQFSKEKIEVLKDEKESKEGHGEHSDILALFNLDCEKSPVGTKLTFNVQKHFPKIHDLDVQIMAGSVQKSVEVKKNGTSVELKP